MKLQFNTLQAGLEQFSKIVAVSVDPNRGLNMSSSRSSRRNVSASQSFTKKDLFLFKEVREINNSVYFSVRDGSGTVLVNDFAIQEHSTMVTKDVIIIRYGEQMITLTVSGGTFAFYNKLFPNQRTTVSIPVL